MASESAASRSKDNAGFLRLLSLWLEPRSQDRDEAFRERSIRIAVLIVTSIGMLSFAFSIFVFRDEWRLISFPTLHVLLLTGWFAAGYTISRRQVRVSALLIIGASLLGASGLVILTGQSGSSTQLISGIPVFMFVCMLGALVLPRNTILPVSMLSVILYVLSVAFTQEPVTTTGSFDLTQGIIASTVFILIGGTILYRLRVEFDSRLDAMRASIKQAEAAQKQAEVARLQAEADRKRAEEADRAKSQFLANMSHELRTPLNAIIGYDEAMLGGMVGEFTPQQSKLLGHIQYNSRRLLGLINDILDLSKIESGSLQVFLAPMSPQKVIRETVESMRSLADEKHIELTIQFSDAVPEVVLGDTSKMQQIVTNLVSNAIKFTDHGRVSVDVSAVDSSRWMLQVRDTGIGMPEDALPTVFEPFHQLDTTDKRKYKGTGLGLAITKRLVEGLGGKIEVSSKLGEGSTFSVVLPRANIPEVAVEAERMEVMEAR